MSISLLLNTTTVYAKNVKTDEDWDKRRAFVEEHIAKLGSQGPEKVDEWLQVNGIYKINDIQNQDVRIASPSGAVTLYNINGYYDTLSRKFVVKGWWTWNDISLVDPTSGALDGVALAMCKTDWNPVTGYVLDSNPAGIAVYDQNGTYYAYAGSASTIDKSGIVYTFQDSWSGTNYTGYR